MYHSETIEDRSKRGPDEGPGFTSSDLNEVSVKLLFYFAFV